MRCNAGRESKHRLDGRKVRHKQAVCQRRILNYMQQDYNNLIGNNDNCNL